MIHITFVSRGTAEYLISGSQTCESRLSLNRHPARGVVPGDTLLIKAGDGRGLVDVRRVDCYDGLTPADLLVLQEMYGPAVDGPAPDPGYWAGKAHARNAVFLWLVNPRPLHVPRHLLPSTQSAWVANWTPPDAVLSLLAGAEGSESNRLPAPWTGAALAVALPRR